MEESRRDIQSQQTRLDISFQKFESAARQKLQFQQLGAWEGSEAGPEETSRRVKKALKDFWYFDNTYFPPAVHRQGYASPGVLHKRILELANTPGLNWILAYRDLAKTAYGLKILLWKTLNGSVVLAGLYSEDLNKARKLKDTIRYIIEENLRLQTDFNIEIITKNEDELSYRCSTNNYIVSYDVFSPERSVRGNVKRLDRPDMIVFDDIETRSSSFKSPIVEERIQRLIEAYKSCKEDGIMLGFGNDLHPDCAANKLLKEQRKGVKRDFIAVHPFPDWSYGKTGEVPYKGSVWPERYPAETEKEMRKMHRITDDIEWSQAQCDPKLKSGHIFPALYYNEYRPEDLPKNIYGVAYCDQNHARKNAGDTTAMGALLFDSATRTYYAVDLKCRSYADPNMLLSDYLKIYKDNICLMGMDGNVSQESTWEAHIVSWCYKNKKDFPPVLFKRYNVDALTTAAQIIYMGGRVLFPAGFKDTEEGQEFFKQFHSFEGKKAGNTDDAADWFICCLNLGFEEGFFDNSEGIEEDFKVVKIDSPFSF